MLEKLRRMTPTRRSVWLTVLVGGPLLVAGGFLVFHFAPSWVSVEGTEADPAVREKILHDARTAAIQFLGVVGLAIGAAFTARTVVINRQGQITERYSKAIEQLGNSELDVRIGAIYALERIARESREDHGPVMEVLTAFVRGRATARRPDAAGARGSVPRPTDVQAALTVIGRRSPSRDRETRFDLRGAYLCNVDLRQARLDDRGVHGRFAFDGAHLEGAAMSAANVDGATFEHAQLQGATMFDCTGFLQLSKCAAQGASIAAADGVGLYEGELEGASFFHSEFTDGFLADAELQGAQLHKLVLQRANFDDADLAGAALSEVDLRGASFRNASLRGAWLRQVDFSGADLTGTDVAGVQADETVKWPAGYENVAIGVGEPHPAAAAVARGERVENMRGLRLLAVTLDLSHVDLSRTDLRGVNLTVERFGNLSGATLRGATFYGDLSRADLRRADARGASFKGATLASANMAYADLRGADLTFANVTAIGLEKANLAGARYDSRTAWPKDFDPVAAGAYVR